MMHLNLLGWCHFGWSWTVAPFTNE